MLGLRDAPKEERERKKGSFGASKQSGVGLRVQDKKEGAEPVSFDLPD